MTKPVKFLLRTILAIAVLAMVPMAFAPSPADAPYQSVLSDIMGSAWAQPLTCPQEVCNKGGSACNPVSLLKRCTLHPTCVTEDC